MLSTELISFFSSSLACHWTEPMWKCACVCVCVSERMAECVRVLVSTGIYNTFTLDYFSHVQSCCFFYRFKVQVENKFQPSWMCVYIFTLKILYVKTWFDTKLNTIFLSFFLCNTLERRKKIHLVHECFWDLHTIYRYQQKIISRIDTYPDQNEWLFSILFHYEITLSEFVWCILHNSKKKKCSIETLKCLPSFRSF